MNKLIKYMVNKLELVFEKRKRKNIKVKMYNLAE